jgi:hypothetical protein
LSRIKLHRQTAQEAAELPKLLHREIALTQEVAVHLVEVLLLQSTDFACRPCLRLKTLEISLLLVLTEVTQCLTHLASLRETSQPLLRTKLTRLLTKALCFKIRLLVSQRSAHRLFSV